MWWSPRNHKDRSRALFVEYDRDFPREDAILAIRIGSRSNGMAHQFRWPLKLMEPLA